MCLTREWSAGEDAGRLHDVGGVCGLESAREKGHGSCADEKTAIASYTSDGDRMG